MRNNDRTAAPNIPEVAPQTTQEVGYTIPTDIVVLPSEGFFYKEDHPLFGKKEIEIKYMTTKEEDILVNPSYAEAGVTMQKLVGSLLIDKRINPETLLAGDINAIVVAARRNAYGATYEFSSRCMVCGKKNKSTANLNNEKNIEYSQKEGIQFTTKGTFFLELPLSKITLELKLLTNIDEKEIEESIRKKQEHGLDGGGITTRYQKMIVAVDSDEGFANKIKFIIIKDIEYLP